MQGDLEKELTCSVSRVLFSRWCCAGEGGDMRQEGTSPSQEGTHCCKEEGAMCACGSFLL